VTPLLGSFGLSTSLVCPWFCLGLGLVCVSLVASHNLQILLYIAGLGTEYCRIQFKLTPLCDRDMPDEIFLSSPCFGSCDTVKVIAVELHTLALFGVKFIAGYAARAKISHLLGKTRFGARIAIFGWLSQFRPFVSTPL